MDSENFVKEELSRQGWIFVAERLRTPFAELDLLLLDEGFCLHVFEVKTAEHGMPYISKAQKARLRRALEHLSHGRRAFPRCHLAVVNQKSLRLVWDFLGR